MSDLPRTLPHPYPPYVARDGTVYPTTRFHWRGEDLAICPVCDCRPCAADCPEQMGATVPTDLAARLDSTPVAQAITALYAGQVPRGRPTRRCVCGVPANSGQAHQEGCCLQGEVTAANYVDSGSGVRHVRPWDARLVAREVSSVRE